MPAVWIGPMACRLESLGTFSDCRIFVCSHAQSWQRKKLGKSRRLSRALAGCSNFRVFARSGEVLYYYHRSPPMPLDWSTCPAVESVPGKLSGAWVFRGTRIPVSAVFENLEDGLTIDEIAQMFDGLARDQVVTVLEFAAQSLEVPTSAR